MDFDGLEAAYEAMEALEDATFEAMVDMCTSAGMDTDMMGDMMQDAGV